MTQVVKTQEVYQTSDYSLFKYMGGNRNVNKAHVKTLIRALEKRNFLDEEPIEVNENMEIIDGQHRFEAAKELGVPIYYVVKENQTIEHVRAKNSGRRNWTWDDYAGSFSGEGNENYTNFLALHEESKLGFRVLTQYVKAATGQKLDHHNIGSGKGGTGDVFISGDLKLNGEGYEKARKLCQQYVALSEIAKQNNREFALGALDFMRRKGYDQEVMEEKLASYSKMLVTCYTASDYFYRLEEIYKRP